MRALRATLLLLVLARVSAAGSDTDADDSDTDDDSDSAPFMIVVEHVLAPADTVWRCSGSLVSLRTGVTSAECARGEQPAAMRELWALAAATAVGLTPRTDGARRVSRVATAVVHQEAGGGERADAPLALAVLELETPFGSGAHCRPILMATAPHECVDSGVCNVVRSLAARRGGLARLRIVDATLADEAPCARAVRAWPAVRGRALCLTGPQLCRSERGAGVVCGGKLCGVVARSAGRGAEDGGQCGDTHAAQSVARWRSFLHCAHTLRSCGRGSCAKLCSERRLLDDGEEEAPPGELQQQQQQQLAHQQRLTPRPAPRAEPPELAAPRPAAPADPAAPDTAAAHDYAAPLEAPAALAVATPSFRAAALPVSLEPVHVAPRTRASKRPDKTRVVSAPGADRARSPAEHAPTRSSRRSPPPPPPPPPLVHVIEPPVHARPAHTQPPAAARYSAVATRSSPVTALHAAPHDLFQADVESQGVSIDLPSPAPLKPPPAAKRRGSGKSRKPASRTPPPPPPPPPVTEPSSVRPTPLFEPNRPDFRAGEYGDNAAEYGAPLDEGPPPTPAPSTTPTTTTTTSTTSATPPPAPRAAAPLVAAAAPEDPEPAPRAQIDARKLSSKRNLAISNLQVHYCSFYLTFVMILLRLQCY